MLPLSAQAGGSQLVVPKTVFVGDTAEVRVVLHSRIDFLADGPERGEWILPADSLPFPAENDDFSLKDARLLCDGAAHSIVLTIVPWRTGALEIPSLDVAAALGADAAPFEVVFQPVEVSSILPPDGTAGLRPPAAPLLVPGTVYAVYGLAVLLIAAAALLFKLAGSRAALVSAVRRRRFLRKCARNARAARKALRTLKKGASRIDDAEFCGTLVRILRNYSSVRFGRDFSAVTAPELPGVFDEAFGGLLDGAALERTEALQRMFLRADYVRFARNSIDSRREPREQYAAALHGGERDGLIASAEEFIRGFEGGGADA